MDFADAVSLRSGLFLALVFFADLHNLPGEEARLLSGAESLVEGVRQLEAARRAAAVWRAVAAFLAVALGAGVVWLLVRG